ncbi:hypothetical protein [Pseudemcibacter aquimaris]|uniref:hypothetical protein n=1 Tax=Pseudemcibacter aquimaris TaxID=2857064 RepID=UPI0020138524|nr:hypothetical protein [Pseudemcibacter aquimaris]MCC3860966.1 hypothetical protein [Pseudemcibacter aquimaris]WDU59784.1 hypothetical protein KW060_05885 [Pseudemcibacter aquimaris]
MSPSIPQILILLIIFVIPIFFAFHLNKKLRENEPTARPYRWGYFNAISMGVSYPLTILLLLITSIITTANMLMLIPFVLTLVIFLPLSWFIYKRYKWPWIVGLGLYGISIFSQLIIGDVLEAILPIIIYTLNVIYVKNRWKELKPTNHESLIIDEIEKVVD